MKKNSITRRDFLKTAAAGAGMLISVSGDTSQIVPQGKKLGIALLGLGRYATGELGPALRLTKNCELRGIVTGTQSKIDRWVVEYNLDRKHVYNYETMDRLVDDKAIDIVYVVTPPALHPNFAIRAAKAGKHVISEKPMATSVEDCDRMIEACKNADKQLGIGYRLHYEPHHAKMLRLIDSGKLGRVEKMSGGFGYAIRQRESRITRSLSGGGPLMDVGIYVIHSACLATGKTPEYVSAKEGLKTNPELFNEVEEGISWTMEFPGGAKCDGFASFSKGANQFRVEGTNGWAEIAPAFSYRGIAGKTHRGEMIFSQVNQQAGQIDEFANCVMAGRKTTVGGELGKRDVRILMAIYEAARTGKRVKV